MEKTKSVETAPGGILNGNPNNSLSSETGRRTDSAKGGGQPLFVNSINEKSEDDIQMSIRMHNKHTLYYTMLDIEKELLESISSGAATTNNRKEKSSSTTLKKMNQVRLSKKRKNIV